ncbi:MAG: aminopeptidase P family protein [Prevotellaceae bacterium]|jgi:Xaa-Pro aminopeptidase|nr:aminopeptidase P family protein [Prevotellaceae bacterium]
MINSNSFSHRRMRLRSLMKDCGGLVVLLSNGEAPMNYLSNVYRYRQDSSFKYFFSQMRDGVVGVIDLDSDADMVFGDDFTIDDIIWMGNQPTVSDLANDCEVNKVNPLSDLDNFVKSTVNSGRKVHYLPAYRSDTLIKIAKLTGQGIEEVKQNVSEYLIRAVVELRLIKSDEEIVELDKICNTGVLMHQTVMKSCKIGQTEQYLAGLAEGVSLSFGNGISFPVILSQNGQTLHNPFHNGILTDGKLLLVDMGAESESGYCSDYTRTLPVGGKFSQKQKEIYEIVLKANLESIKLAKPGIKWQDVHFNACKIVAEGLISVGLMNGNAEEAVELGATSLFMPHGLGHALGMDVHDMESLGENFVGYDRQVGRSTVFGHASLRFGKETKVGNVLTVEPGIYFIPQLIDIWVNEGKFKDFINYHKLEQYRDFGGIRIEDDIVITDNGCRVLGKPLEKTVDEVQNILI